jgi:hypothetical protein
MWACCKLCNAGALTLVRTKRLRNKKVKKAPGFVGRRAVSSHGSSSHEADSKLRMFGELEDDVTKIKSKCGSTTCRAASTSWSHFSAIILNF